MKPIYESDESESGQPTESQNSVSDSASQTHTEPTTTSQSSWGSLPWIVLIMMGIAFLGFGSSAGWFSSDQPEREQNSALSDTGQVSGVDESTSVGVSTSDSPSQSLAGPSALPAAGSPGSVTGGSPAATLPPLPLNPVPPTDGQGILDECRLVLEHLRQAYPESLEAKEVTARFEYEFGETPVASQLWNEILEVNPNYVYALRGLGDVATIDGQLDEAVRYFRRAVLADPNSLSRQVTLGIALLHAARLDEAKQVLSAVLAKEPGHIGAHVELASVLLELEEFDEARKHFETALEATSGKAELHFGLATAYRRLGQLDKAKFHFEEHRRLQKDVQSDREQGRRNYDDLEAMRIDVARFYVDTARIYLAAGSRQPAERLLVRANRMDPTNFDALQALAFLASQDGQVFEAIKWMKEVAKLQPDEYAYASETARLYLQAGQPAQAEQVLTQFVQEHPQDLAAVRSTARFFLEASADPDRAIEYGLKAIELAPTAESYAMMASIYDAAQENEKAIQALEQALELDPANATYQQVLALMRENATLEKIDQ